MTRGDIEQLLARHKTAYLNRDIEALTACHAPDGSFESPAYGTIRGRDAIREVYRYWYRAFPDLMLTWESALDVRGQDGGAFLRGRETRDEDPNDWRFRM